MTRQALFQRIDEVLPALETGAALLTPNRRLARAAAEAYGLHQQRRGRRAWTTPPIYPLAEYWQHCWREAVNRGALPPQPLLQRHQQLQLWREVIDSSDVGFSLLASAPTAESCLRARQLLSHWQVDTGARATRQEFSFEEDSQAFMSWLEAFNQRLRQRDCLCDEDSETLLLNLPDALVHRELILLDTVEIPPLYEALLARAQSCTRRLRESGSVTGNALVACDDARHELRAIARWCRQRSLAVPAERIAVVLPDMGQPRELLEMFLRDEFGCLTDDYESLPVNFATGLHLQRVPLVRDALRLLAIADDPLPVSALRALLVSPFIAAPLDAGDDGSHALQDLLDLGATTVSQSLLCACFGEAPSEAPWNRVASLRRLERWGRRERLPSQWIDPFRQVLAAWGWLRGRALDSLEYQQFERFQATLDALADYDTSLSKIGYGAALALLRDHCAQTLFQPHTDDAGIHVLGPREIVGLHFDALWIAGMGADRWPAAPRPNPYLPASLQKRCRMPRCDAAWEREHAHRQLRLWSSAARDVRFSFVALVDDAAVPASALLPPLPTTQSDAIDLDPRWQAQRAALPSDAVTAGPAPLESWERASRGAGSSLLRAQVQCPFQAFAAQRLFCGPDGVLVPGLSPSERGVLVHEALYRLFGDFSGSEALLAADASEREQRVEKAVNTAHLRLPARRRAVLPTSCLTIERTRLRALLLDWLALESARPAPFAVDEREAENTLQLGPLSLTLRVDRIDRLADGSRLLIDYKTGAVESPGQWFKQPPGHPQLPLYALLEPHVDGVSYAVLRSGKLAFVGVAERAGVAGLRDDLEKVSGDLALGDMASIRDFWQGELEAVAREFVAGGCEVEPRRADSCAFCARQALCRLAEVGT